MKVARPIRWVGGRSTWIHQTTQIGTPLPWSGRLWPSLVKLQLPDRKARPQVNPRVRNLSCSPRTEGAAGLGGTNSLHRRYSANTTPAQLALLLLLAPRHSAHLHIHIRGVLSD